METADAVEDAIAVIYLKNHANNKRRQIKIKNGGSYCMGTTKAATYFFKKMGKW